MEKEFNNSVSIDTILKHPNSLNLSKDNSDKTLNIVYSREFIIKYKCVGNVDFISKVPYKKPRVRHNKHINNNDNIILRVEPLDNSVNSWSQNRISNDEFIILNKKMKGLFNKLTVEKYDSISEQFIECMKDYTFTQEQLNEFIPSIYQIILNQIVYNSIYIQMIKKYNNNEFNNFLINKSKKEFEISIKKIEDDRNISSSMENVETIKKRYSLNNLSFIIDSYNMKMIDKKEMDDYIESLISSKEINLLCHAIKILFKIPMQSNLFEKSKNTIKLASCDKQYPSQTRFLCMDVLDIINPK